MVFRLSAEQGPGRKKLLGDGTPPSNHKRHKSLPAPSAASTHTGSETHQSEGEGDTWSAFVANLNRAGVRDMVCLMVTTSEEAARSWQGQVGLLWIDASHEYADVRRDFDYWFFGPSFDPLANHTVDLPFQAPISTME